MPMNINNIKNIFKTKKLRVKIFVSHLLGIIVLLAFTRVAVMYADGKFELPFYDRAKNNNVSIQYPTDQNDSDNLTVSEEETTEHKDSVLDVINPSDLAESDGTQSTEENVENTEVTEPMTDFEVFSDDMKKDGFNVSDGIYELYDEAKTLYEINRYQTEVNRILNEYNANKTETEGENANSETEEVPVLPSAPLLYEYRFVKIEPKTEIPKSQKTTESYIIKQTVEPHMDYIIIRQGENETLCDSSGKIITRDFANIGVEILNMRDEFGNTVFKKDNAYFIYDPTAGETANGAFVEIKFDELIGDRGVPFMYPSYYGANGANGLDIGYYIKWGYLVTGTQNIKITRIYDKAFNFSENIGIVYQEAIGKGKKIFFLDENGWNYLNDSYSYYAPDKMTKDHLGFFYFDHGLTRVYEREFDPRRGIVGERDRIVDVYGRPFYIPDDYNIKSYSQGMILLEKNGYYGFMNYLGEWVAQPIYKYAQPFYEGVAVIGLENGKKALIDVKGNLVAKFKYDVITNCTGGIVALYEKNEGWTILNKVRKTISPDIDIK